AVMLVSAVGVGVREAQLRRRAEAAANRARAVQEYLVEVFQASDPFGRSLAPGREVTARTLLARGAERVDAELAREPAVQAEMLGILGRVYTNLGLFEQAAPLLERSLAQRRSVHGDRHAGV